MFGLCLQEPDPKESTDRLQEMFVANLDAPGKLAVEEYAAVPCEVCADLRSCTHAQAQPVVRNQ